MAGAKRERVEEKDGVLTVCVKEPPRGNMANRRVVQIVSRHFRVPVAQVKIVTGHHRKGKTLEIKGA